MADILPAPVPLHLMDIEADGWCDAATGVCAVPEAASAAPASEALPPDEPDAEPPDA